MSQGKPQEILRLFVVLDIKSGQTPFGVCPLIMGRRSKKDILENSLPTGQS